MCKKLFKFKKISLKRCTLVLKLPHLPPFLDFFSDKNRGLLRRVPRAPPGPPPPKEPVSLFAQRAAPPFFRRSVVTSSTCAMDGRLFFVLCVLVLGVFAKDAKDMTRKSIVFDKNTPDVFYCPIHKPTGFDKLIVK